MKPIKHFYHLSTLSKARTLKHLTDIPRQREEYEVIYGTISLLFFELEWNICFIIHQIHNPEWCMRKHKSNSKKLKVNCSRPIIIQNMCSKDM